MLLVEQNANLALDLADHAYLFETGRMRSPGREPRSRTTKPCAAPIWAIDERTPMHALLHQILSGIANGGIYASLALALVMIYQSTHLVNFAQGEMAMFSTYIAWAMIDAGTPYWAAFVLTFVFALHRRGDDRAASCSGRSRRRRC